eukprot:superscaffoldBa00001524_g10949
MSLPTVLEAAAKERALKIKIRSVKSQVCKLKAKVRELNRLKKTSKAGVNKESVMKQLKKLLPAKAYAFVVHYDESAARIEGFEVQTHSVAMGIKTLAQVKQLTGQTQRNYMAAAKFCENFDSIFNSMQLKDSHKLKSALSDASVHFPFLEKRMEWLPRLKLFECEYQAVATGLMFNNSERTNCEQDLDTFLLQFSTYASQESPHVIIDTEPISAEHCYTSQDSPRITIDTGKIMDAHDTPADSQHTFLKDKQYIDLSLGEKGLKMPSMALVDLIIALESNF